MEPEPAGGSASVRRAARITLLVSLAFVAATSALGGVALIFSPVIGATPFTLPAEYLEGSAFSNYVVPGIVLLVVVAGTHAVAFWLVNRRRRGGAAAASVAGFGILIWIFVQMVVIPFTPLQAIYFGLGLLELGLVLLLLDVFSPRHTRDRA